MPHISGFKIDGEVVPSVTEIVGLIAKPYLDQWKRRVGFEEADRVMNTAAELGRTAHDLVDQYLQGKEVVGDTQAHKLFEVWKEWWLKSGYQLIATEKHLVSKKYLYQGSTDAILR